MKHRVTLIPGDGIGPEVAAATRLALEATGVELEWDVQEAGSAVAEREGSPLPDRVLDSLRANKVGIKGPITTPIGKGFRSVNVTLRQSLDLYACVRPCRSYPGVRSPFEGVDLVVVRENTEDLYSGIEFQVGSPGAQSLRELVERETGMHIRPDSGISIKPISVAGTERIVRYAFDYARSHGRRKVTVVHKANIMKFTDGLFLDVARKVAGEYGDIAFEETIVDNMCMQLVQHPQNYDVIVLSNLYGDIVSDLAAGLVGGLGMAPGGNIGTHAALFEPTHGSAPSLAGSHRVNPMAMMLSGVMMLAYLNEPEAAARLERAVAHVIREGRHVTFDMNARPDDAGAASTEEVTEAVIEAMHMSRTGA